MLNLKYCISRWSDIFFLKAIYYNYKLSLVTLYITLYSDVCAVL